MDPSFDPALLLQNVAAVVDICEAGSLCGDETGWEMRRLAVDTGVPPVFTDLRLLQAVMEHGGVSTKYGSASATV